MPQRPAKFRRLVGAAGLLLAAACCAGALAGQGGRFSAALDVATHFSPLFLAGGGLALVLWLTGGMRGAWTPVLAVIGAAASLWLMAPELKAAHAAAEVANGQPLKLVQFNLWGDNTDTDATTAWILKTDPDILALEDAFDKSQPVVDAMAARFPHRFSVGSTHLFSKTPILDQRQVFTGSSLWARVQGPDGRALTVMVTHLSWPLWWRRYAWQSERLVRSMEELHSDDLILAGDFNLTPWSFAMRRFDRDLGLERRTRAMASWPAIWAPLPPVLPIDQVFAGRAWRTVSVERGPKLGSDHYPIVAILARN